jgi:AcrR family transcriptional regulator
MYLKTIMYPSSRQGGIAMPPARLTREESRGRTRARLVEAGAKVFAARGFGAASQEEIAAEAGFTRGAVYSNFADKAELFLTVLEEREQRRVEEVRAIYAGSGSAAAFFANLGAAEEHRSRDAEEWLILRLEFLLYAVRNPAVRPALVDRNRQRIAALEPAIAAVLEAEGVGPPRPISEIAQVVQGLDEGLAVLRMVDPDGIRADLFLDTLGLLVESAVALDRLRGAPAKRATRRDGARRRPRGEGDQARERPAGRTK